jgi:hypothetical protein
VLEHLVGENIRRCPMALTSLECRVSALVNSDARPRPTTHHPEGPTAQLLADAHIRALDLGFGRIVASEIEAPSMFAVLV